MHDGKGSMTVRERWLILSANFHDSISLLFNPRGICLCTKWPFSLEIVQRTQQHHIQRLSPSPTPFPSSTRHPRDLFAPLRDLKPNHGLNRAAKLSRSVLPIKTVSESELREYEYQCCSLHPPGPPISRQWRAIKIQFHQIRARIKLWISRQVWYLPGNGKLMSF